MAMTRASLFKFYIKLGSMAGLIVSGGFEQLHGPSMLAHRSAVFSAL